MKLSTQKQVDGAPKGMHGLGSNLWLDVRNETSKAWLFIWKIDGRNQSAGLGSASGSKGHKVSLVEARKKADHYRALVSQGKNPRDEERKATLTLGQAAEAYIERHKGSWRSSKTEQRWRRSFVDHAKELADMRLAAITAADIRPVVDRLWHRPAGRELRYRLETIFRDNRTLLGADHVNPATMDALGLTWRRRQRGSIRHHPAMPYDALPGFMAALRERETARAGMRGRPAEVETALALQLLILTATRTGEVLHADWREFRLDGDDRRWTIPAERTKSEVEHVLPLTRDMLAVLERIPRRKDNRLFDLGSNTLLKALQAMPGCSGYTVHGFRSTYRDWCGNETAFDREVIEETYGHDPALNDAERAYRRSKAMKKRRMVLEAWNAYATASKVIPFPAPAQVA
jgi:integrase